MEWINNPNEGISTLCNNCFFYAHGLCPEKCPSQACTIRF